MWLVAVRAKCRNMTAAALIAARAAKGCRASIPARVYLRDRFNLDRQTVNILWLWECVQDENSAAGPSMRSTARCGAD